MISIKVDWHMEIYKTIILWLTPYNTTLQHSCSFDSLQSMLYIRPMRQVMNELKIANRIAEYIYNQMKGEFYVEKEKNMEKEKYETH